MKKVLMAGILLSVTIFFSCGESNQKTDAGDTVSIAETKLCGKCGEIKGSANCCNKDAEKCGKCGLIKGSPGCCKIEGDAVLCSNCGEIKGSANCCNKEAEKCDKCGLIKGSPGCCKIKKN